MKNISYEILGWYGVLAVLIAYALSNFNVLKLDSLLYLMLNLTGSFAIAAEAFKKRDFQPVALNIVWLLVAGISLTRLIIQ